MRLIDCFEQTLRVCCEKGFFIVCVWLGANLENKNCKTGKQCQFTGKIAMKVQRCVCAHNYITLTNIPIREPKFDENLGWCLLQGALCSCL